MNTSSTRYRSFFWPVILIGIGLIWLAGNLGWLPKFEPWTLFSLWPLLLIGIGLDLLFGRRYPIAGGFVGLAVVGVAAVMIYNGFTFTPQQELKTAHYSTPLEQAETAEIDLSLGRGTTELLPLDSETILLEADVKYVGNFNYQALGRTDVQIKLGHGSDFTLVPSSAYEDQQSLDIALNNAIPVQMQVQNSGGEADLQMQEIQLTGFELSLSGGEIQVELPAMLQGYPLKLDVSGGGGVLRAAPGVKLQGTAESSGGELQLTLGAGALADLKLSASGGELIIELPPGADVRVEVERHSGGNVNLPAGFTQVEGAGGEEGAWETDGYTAAEAKITILVTSISGGNITIRR